jgi:hypothetical protein
MRFDRALGASILLLSAGLSVRAGSDVYAPKKAAFSPVPTTLVTLPLDSEGLIVDPDTGVLYTAEAPNPAGDCIVRSVTLSGVVQVVGVLPKPAPPCAPRGLEFRNGRLYIADQGAGATGWIFEMDPATGQSTIVASGMAGANGIVFDSHGNLWITDSLRGFGRVYRWDAITGAVSEAFRVPPVGNGTVYGGKMTTPTTLGIGRQIANLPAGMQSEVRQVANGIAVLERYSDDAEEVRRGRPLRATLYVPTRREERFGTCSSTPRAISNRDRPDATQRYKTTRCAKKPSSRCILDSKGRMACGLTPTAHSGRRRTLVMQSSRSMLAGKSPSFSAIRLTPSFYGAVRTRPTGIPTSSNTHQTR